MPFVPESGETRGAHARDELRSVMQLSRVKRSAVYARVLCRGMSDRALKVVIRARTFRKAPTRPDTVS